MKHSVALGGRRCTRPACKLACPAPAPLRQVAALVPGKTKAQCFKRFKELKEQHKAKKASG